MPLDIRWRRCYRTHEAVDPSGQALDPRSGRIQSLHSSYDEYDYPAYYHLADTHQAALLVGTEAALGIHPPNAALLYVICSPVGPYYRHGFKPVALYGTTEYTRASPGGKYLHIYCLPLINSYCHTGIGAYKLSANYAPGVMVQKEAAKKGYIQNLWLYGPEHHVTEVLLMLGLPQSADCPH